MRCPYNTIGNSFTQTCEEGKVCPLKNYYVDPETRFCEQCASLCLSCYGPLEENCLKCHTDQYLFPEDKIQKNSDIMGALQAYIIDDDEATYLKLVQKLNAKSKITCDLCNTNGYTVDWNYGICQKCLDRYCLKCAAPRSCEICDGNHFTSLENVCILKDTVNVSIEETEMPLTYQISMNSSWPEFIEDLRRGGSTIQITFSPKVPKAAYSIHIEEGELDTYLLTVKMSQNLPKGTLIKFSLKSPGKDDVNSIFKFQNSSFSISTPGYIACPSDFEFSLSKNLSVFSSNF